MVVNIILGAVIFGYAGYALIRHIQKSKQGKCAACAVKDACKDTSTCSKTV